MSSPSRKRNASPEFVSNPFVKRRNLEWSISLPPFQNADHRHREAEGLSTSARPPGQDAEAQPSAGECPQYGPQLEAAREPKRGNPQKPQGGLSASAAIENNAVKITDHLAWFSNLLTKATLQPFPAGQPRLSIPTYQSLYIASFQSPAGAHFVVTEHNHPVAGPHYDLRLQINGDSSCSWAIMYGTQPKQHILIRAEPSSVLTRRLVSFGASKPSLKCGDSTQRANVLFDKRRGAFVISSYFTDQEDSLPGHPNSRGRTGRATGAGVLRNATETRVHCLWNHLVETAGSHTGSLLVWDTGSYEVLLPRRSKYAPADSQEEGSDGGEQDRWGQLTQQEKLAAAFSLRKIRLRLNGSKLPQGYAVNLHLTKNEDAAGRAKAVRPPGTRKGRRRKAPPKKAPETSSDSDDSGPDRRAGGEDGEEEYNDGSTSASKDVEGMSEMERELRELEDAEVSRTNAYPGAVNTIGSMYQRKWFLSLDREECGFVKTKKDRRVWWERQEEDEQGNDQGQGRLQWPFYVRGPGHERSIVTGRLGAEILRDEGVVGYVERKGWRPILR